MLDTVGARPFAELGPAIDLRLPREEGAAKAQRTARSVKMLALHCLWMLKRIKSS